MMRNFLHPGAGRSPWARLKFFIDEWRKRALVAEAVRLRRHLIDSPGDEADEAFTRWITRSATHLQVWVELEAFDEELLQYLQDHPEVRISEEAPVEEERVLRHRVAWAAGLVVTALIGGAIYAVLAPDTYKTEVGGLQRTVLPDGSVLTLNTDTKVEVRYGDQARRLTLVYGEALFKVAKKEGVPFEVSAGDKTVVATGTEFSVRMYGPPPKLFRLRAVERVEVLVQEGTVKLGPLETEADEVGAGVLAILTPGTSDVARETVPDVEARLKWVDQRLSLQGRPLAEVVQELNRYNDTQLEIADPQIAAIRGGGMIYVTELDDFLKAVEAWGVTSRREKKPWGEEKVVLTAKNPDSRTEHTSRTR